HSYKLVLIGLLLFWSTIAYLGSFFGRDGFNYLYIIPHNKGITTEHFWQAGVDWILNTFFFGLKAFSDFLIIN